jgi:hypothetical protein
MIQCFSDLLQPLDLAPPTKQLMKLKENSQLEKILTMPSCMEWLLDPQIIKVECMLKYQSYNRFPALSISFGATCFRRE